MAYSPTVNRLSFGYVKRKSTGSPTSTRYFSFIRSWAQESVAMTPRPRITGPMPWNPTWYSLSLSQSQLQAGVRQHISIGQGKSGVCGTVEPTIATGSRSFRRWRLSFLPKGQPAISGIFCSNCIQLDQQRLPVSRNAATNSKPQGRGDAIQCGTLRSWLHGLRWG